MGSGVRVVRSGAACILPGMSNTERLVDAMSAVDSLENAVTGQGGRKDSRRDGVRSFSYHRKTHIELLELYRSNWLAGEVTEIPAFEMTREGRSFQSDNTRHTDDIAAEAERLNLWGKVRECIQWADLLGGGALLLGIDGDEDLKQPLDVTKVQKGALRYVHALDARTVFPHAGTDTQLVYDPTSPQFMQPEFYTIAAAKMPFIHHTRLILFHGVALPWLEMQRTLWWGGSRIERMFDAIADAETVTGGVAELVTEAKIDVYAIKDLMTLVATPEGEARIRKRIEIVDQMKSIYDGFVIDTEERYEQKQNMLVQGMGPLIEQYLAIAAAAAGIPVTRLLGTSAKGLSATGEGDLRNFYDMIKARQTSYLRPRLCALDEVFIRSAVGADPADLPWTFDPLWQLSETEQAAIESSRATRDQIYLQTGVVTELEVVKQLREDATYVSIDAEYVDEVEKAIKFDLDNPEPGPDPAPAKPNPTTEPAPAE